MGTFLGLQLSFGAISFILSFFPLFFFPRLFVWIENVFFFFAVLVCSFFSYDWIDARLACSQSNLFTVYLFNDLQTIHSQSALRKAMNNCIFHSNSETSVVPPTIQNAINEIFILLYSQSFNNWNFIWNIFNVFYSFFAFNFRSVGFIYLILHRSKREIRDYFHALTVSWSVAFYIYSL